VSGAGGPIRAVDHISSLALRWYARRAVANEVDVEVHGRKHVPTTGPVVFAARHYHHLHDATILMSVVPRQLHILVALDWVRGPWGRRIMEVLCRAARWPTVLRRDSPHLTGDAPASVYHPDEWHGMMRQAILDSTDLLRDGRVLVVFPEGYPNIDPEGAAKAGPDDFLPFKNGFARIVARAQRTLGRPIPVVPVGFAYQRRDRWQATVRFGAPRQLAPDGNIEAFVRLVERDVQVLSRGAVTDRIRV
jgi:1-acyl-sn-glycerol-3-phosphate acyltransferase